MLCETALKYLSKTWLKEIALWTRATIDLLQFVLKKHVYGNNMHAEGVVKDVKSKPDVKLTCKEPASFLWENYRNLKRNARMFVNN